MDSLKLHISLLMMKGKIKEEIKYFSSFEEEGKIIAQSDPRYINAGKFDGEQVAARKDSELALVRSDEIDLMDVSPQQMISIATSLIPFLEHDDANRALDGIKHDETGCSCCYH